MSRLKDVEQCHLLYVSSLDRSKTIQLLTENIKFPILTIGGDESHFVEDGGMVEFLIIDGKVNIHVNLSSVKQAGLKISSRVLMLATTVINP